MYHKHTFIVELAVVQSHKFCRSRSMAAARLGRIDMLVFVIACAPAAHCEPIRPVQGVFVVPQSRPLHIVVAAWQ